MKKLLCLGLMLFCNLAQAELISSGVDLQQTWSGFGKSGSWAEGSVWYGRADGTSDLANSFTTTSAGQVNRLGTYGSLNNDANLGPDLQQQLASTSIVAHLQLPELSYVEYATEGAQQPSTRLCSNPTP